MCAWPQVFRRLNARIIHLYRDPIAQYLSIQRGRESEVKGKGDMSWHCFDANASSCGKKSEPSTMHVDIRDAGYFVKEAVRLRQLARRFDPIFSRSFEDCVGHGGTGAAACVGEIYRALGLPPRTAPINVPRVS